MIQQPQKPITLYQLISNLAGPNLHIISKPEGNGLKRFYSAREFLKILEQPESSQIIRVWANDGIMVVFPDGMYDQESIVVFPYDHERLYMFFLSGENSRTAVRDHAATHAKRDESGNAKEFCKNSGILVKRARMHIKEEIKVEDDQASICYAWTNDFLLYELIFVSAYVNMYIYYVNVRIQGEK